MQSLTFEVGFNYFSVQKISITVENLLKDVIKPLVLASGRKDSGLILYDFTRGDLETAVWQLQQTNPFTGEVIPARWSNNIELNYSGAYVLLNRTTQTIEIEIETDDIPLNSILTIPQSDVSVFRYLGYWGINYKNIKHTLSLISKPDTIDEGRTDSGLILYHFSGDSLSTILWQLKSTDSDTGEEIPARWSDSIILSKSCGYILRIPKSLLKNDLVIIYENPDEKIDIHKISKYDDDGNETMNSIYRLRNLQPSRAILQDEIQEMIDYIHFQPLDDSFNLETDLSQYQVNRLKELVDVGKYIILYKESSFSIYSRIFDSFSPINPLGDYEIQSGQTVLEWIRSWDTDGNFREIDGQQFYVLYANKDIYVIPDYNDSGEAYRNSRYRLRNFQPNDSEFQDEINEMKNTIHFKEIDDNFDFETNLSELQKNFIKQLLIENTEPEGTAGSGPYLIIYKKKRFYKI